MSTQPIYTTMTQIAKTLGYTTSNLPHLIAKWHNDPDLPCPPPDAYLAGTRGTPTPLWLQEHLPDWEAWNQKRITLTEQRHQHLRETQGPKARPGRPAGPPKPHQPAPTNQP